jgi:hypothetical protein
VTIRKLFTVVMMLCASSGALADEQEAVVLLHGYGRTGYSMLFLESRLKAEDERQTASRNKSQQKPLRPAPAMRVTHRKSPPPGSCSARSH